MPGSAIRDPWRGGRGYRKHSFTYQDFARLYDVTVDTVRRWVSRGRLDPNDLRSIIALHEKRSSHTCRR